LEPNIGTFETRFFTFETTKLDFRKVVLGLSLKGIILKQTHFNEIWVHRRREKYFIYTTKIREPCPNSVGK
jgi:hypothetical protein